MSDCDMGDYEYEDDGGGGGDGDDGDDFEYQYSDSDDESKIPVAVPLARQQSYQVFDETTLQARLDAYVKDIVELLCVSKEEAIGLVYSCKWNKRTLENEWFEHEDKVRATAHVSRRGAAKPFKGGDCGACMEPLTQRTAHALACQHPFCLDCWKCYLAVKLEDRGVLDATCMQDGCKERVLLDTIETLLEPKQSAAYRRLLLKSFVDQNTYVRWCPAPGCTHAVEYPAGGPKDIQCACGHKFCFQCSEEIHRPATCEHVRLWRIKNNAESENVTWILANTKKCPACTTPIEKNQGCNHMTCRVGGCGHEFCWLCLGPWAEHGASTGGFYKCNKWDNLQREGKTSVEETRRVQAANALSKYVHYFNRYINHDRARKIATAGLPNLQRQMDDLQTTLGLKPSDVSFIKDAVAQIIECRQVLKWTYVFAYYMTDPREKNLFEHLQEMLEKNTENLHHAIETELVGATSRPGTAFVEYRARVTNYTGITKKFLQNLLTGVESGLTDTAT